MITPHIFIEAGVRLPRARIMSLVRIVGEREFGRRQEAVNIVFTTDARMKTLNRRFRGLPKTTDVLSFQLDDGIGASDVLGEIYISVPTARRQAREYGSGIWNELLRLVCHGLLHLAGYDHQKQPDADRMRQREERYLRQVSKIR